MDGWLFGLQRTSQPLLAGAPIELTGGVDEFQSWVEGLNEDKPMPGLWKGIQAVQCGKKRKFKEAFTTGEVPFGFPGSKVWPKIVSNLKEVKKKMEESQKRKQTRIQELRAELAICETQYSLEIESKYWEKMSQSCEESTELAQNFQHAEEELSVAIEKELSNPEDLSSEHLSLVFNAVGLSSFIKHAAGMDGEEFLDVHTDVSFDGITKNEYLDILYCRHMLEIRKVPYKKHDNDDCAVCCCSTPEALVDLVVEHEEWGLDTDVVTKHELTGPRFLIMSTTDLETLFSIPKAKAKTIWKEKKQIHHDSLH